ncbi:hypothetical protein EDB86DRAFT_3218707 [Lactarius hatsudake]|nr:hypothetical protein EDB86DRAFT_3218707 [Lactarius hatsudake]
MGKDTGNEVAWSLYLTEPAPSPRGALRIFTFVSFLFKYGKDSIRGIAAFDLNGEWYDLDDIARYVCPLTAFEEPVHYGYLVLSTQCLQLECVKKAFGWSPPGRLYRPESLSRGPRTRERPFTYTDIGHHSGPHPSTNRCVRRSARLPVVWRCPSAGLIPPPYDAGPTGITDADTSNCIRRVKRKTDDLNTGSCVRCGITYSMRSPAIATRGPPRRKGECGRVILDEERNAVFIDTLR